MKRMVIAEIILAVLLLAANIMAFITTCWYRDLSHCLQAGNFCNIECFGGLHGYGGDIAKIEYLGRKWEP